MPLILIVIIPILLIGIMSKVVESYLAHNGFSETVRVFASATDAQLPPSALSIDPRKGIYIYN